MGILQILKIICALGTAGTGLFALIKPRSAFGFTGLTAPGPRGITEIRAVMGGLFIGAGLFPLFFNNPLVFQMLGVIYLAIGGVRLVSIFLDHSTEQSNWISLAVEAVFGLILVL